MNLCFFLIMFSLLLLLLVTTTAKQVVGDDVNPTATAMKRTKVTSVGKKSKPGDDQTLSDVKKSKEVSKPSVLDDQTRPKRTPQPGRQAKEKAKSVELSIPAKKKGKPSKGDSAKITTPNIVEKNKEHVTRELPTPITCVMGLQCKSVTLSQIKKPKIAHDVKNPPNFAPLSPKTTGGNRAPLSPKTTGGNRAPLSPKTTGGNRAPLSPKTTGNLEETDTLKRKRGRPFKTHEDKIPKSPLPLPDAEKEVPVVHGKEKVQVLPAQKKNTLKQQKKSKSVKGKRGKRRKISSITVGSSPQSKKQKENENENGVEKSLDLSISDDQPLSKWFEVSTLNTTSKKHHQTESVKSPPPSNGQQNLSFEKRSTLWSTLESMELFKMIPQNPHFQPLDKEKECTREGQAIAKMVTYLRVVEATSQLKLSNPKTVVLIEDNLDSLVELERHGFDVKVVRDRLTELLSIKERQERLERESKKLKEKLEVGKAEAQWFDKEIELVDKQVVALMEKRAHVLLKKEKRDSEVGALELEADGIRKGISEAKCKFDGLVASELCVSNQQTPP